MGQIWDMKTTVYFLSLVFGITVLVRVPQRNRINKISRDTWKEMYYEGLAHTIEDWEIPQSAVYNWRPRKAGGVVLV